MIYMIDEVQHVPTEKITPNPNNSKTHSDFQVVQIARSIEEYGFLVPVLIDEDYELIAGEGRWLAAKNKLELEEIPAVIESHLSERQRRAFMIADNKINENGGWDMETLSSELSDLAEMEMDLSLTGFDEQELDGLLKNDPAILPEGFADPTRTGEDYNGGAPGEGEEPEEGGGNSRKGALKDDFLVPPFSTLNARDSWWQKRKQAWQSLGIKSEVGRDAVLDSMGSAYQVKVVAGSNQKKKKADVDIPSWATTSIFDPVLCELVYRWFTPPGGVVIDPFAGGSVRGVVASKLGRQYYGVELRAEQVQANKIQGRELCEEPRPEWVQGDSMNFKDLVSVNGDFLFSCPPYADLEKYSEEPGDISNMSYDGFMKNYREIIKRSAARLKENRFACFVVGEVRNNDGYYYNFVGDTIEAFKAAGLEYYNEGILLTMYGSVPIRTRQPFEVSRKLGKCHQNVLFFVKGDERKAAEACGVVGDEDFEIPGAEQEDQFIIE